MDNLAYLLIKASRHLKTSLDQALGSYEITASQFSVLNQVSNGDGMITSAEIATILSSDRPTISGIINRLEDKKLLVKKDHPNDKRSSYLGLTSNGRDLIKVLRDCSHKVNEDVFMALTMEEQIDLESSLLKLLQKLEEEK